SRNQHLGWRARRAAVVLEHERLENRLRVFPCNVLEVEAVAVDHLAVTKRKDLHRGPVAVDCEPDHVDRSNGTLLGRLAVREMPDREEAIPVPRRLLETLFRRRLAHALPELVLDRLRVTREESDHAVDDLRVALAGDRADARSEAAVDVEVEARDPRVTARARSLARAEAEDAVEHVERLAHLLRVRVRAEVDGPAAVPLASEHDARVLVGEGHCDVRERLVVAETDVERRPVPLDEILLEVERLGLALRHDHLDPVDALDELADARAGVAAAVPVAPDAGTQRFRLADVEDLVALVAKQVHARTRRQPFQLLPNGIFTHRS